MVAVTSSSTFTYSHELINRNTYTMEYIKTLLLFRLFPEKLGRSMKFCSFHCMDTLWAHRKASVDLQPKV